jgi:hypothetical protein
MRLRQRLITAINECQRQKVLLPEKRALDYRTHRPIVEAVIREMTIDVPDQTVWWQMLDGLSTRMVRRVPPTILAKRRRQALLPPMSRNRGEMANTWAAFLAVQFYLNYSLKGLGRARQAPGVAETEQKLARLSSLMACEKLMASEAGEAKDILNVLRECEIPAQEEG